MMSPDKALNYLKELRNDLENGWIDIYEPAGGADEIVIEALEVAIAALEEKKDE